MAITEEQGRRIRAFEKRTFPKYPYWYGMNRALYKSVNLPEKQPVSCHLQHGAVMMFNTEKPDYLTLNTHYPVIFLDNEEQVEFCENYKEKKITKPIHIVGSIFPRYRRSEGIEQRPDAKGSLAVISHSTHATHVDSDWKQLIEEYKQLPEQYHPITVSIYYRDYLLGLHELFTKEGFDVITSGHMTDPTFVDNFYGHLSKFKYVVANDMGSHAYYAIEMGIPFFLHGPPGNYKVVAAEPNKAKDNYLQKDYDRLGELYEWFTPSAEEIEAGIEISTEQREFVRKMTGYYVALSDEEIRAIIERTKWGFYAKEILLSPIKIPLKLYRAFKARTKKVIH